MENTLLSALKHSGFLGHMILLSLFLLSVFVWSTFLRKWKAFKKMENDTGAFIDEFRTMKKDIFELASRLGPERECPVSALYVATLKDLQYYFVREGRTKIPPHALDDLFNGMQRRLSALEVDQKEGMILLATATTVSPLLGLFGTVYGIMEAFRDMWIHGSANITVVAPGISDALLTTVFGLAVAIPSSIAYNMLYARMSNYHARAENFCSELISSIERTYVER